MIQPSVVRFLALSSLLAICALTVLRPSAASSPNVVVVLVDTLRADRLGAYGNTRGLTPFLDSLATRGTVFRRTYAASSWTQPSVASIFTSRFQSQHGVMFAASQLKDSEITLAEVLRDHGYATGAFSANGLIGAQLGYAQGFDRYEALWGKPADETHPKPQKYRADTINALAQAWVGTVSAGRPFFLYVHYLEPHAPFSPPDAMLDRVLGGRPHPNMDELTDRLFLGNVAPPSAEGLREIEDVYDAEVASVDASIRDLYTFLEKRGLLENTVLVVTADHGEGFSEHGLIAHGNSLYEEVLRVPLLVVAPGGPARVAVEEPVSLLDVGPTVLDLVGVSVPPSFEGHSRQPAILGAPASAAHAWPVFSEHVMPDETMRLTPHERAVVTKRGKLIIGVHGERESYDLVNDPGEHTPLPEVDTVALADILDAFRSRVMIATPQAPPVDPVLRAKLRALGYFNN